MTIWHIDSPSRSFASLNETWRIPPVGKLLYPYIVNILETRIVGTGNISYWMHNCDTNLVKKKRKIYGYNDKVQLEELNLILCIGWGKQFMTSLLKRNPRFTPKYRKIAILSKCDVLKSARDVFFFWVRLTSLWIFMKMLAIDWEEKVVQSFTVTVCFERN